MSELSLGLTGEARRVVTDEMTAVHLGSGDVAVLGTPSLLALMEEAACAALHGKLEEGKTSVGTWVELTHDAPSRVGAEVRALARLIDVDGRMLTFECEAYDGDTMIGRANHKRAIVSRARFT